VEPLVGLETSEPSGEIKGEALRARAGYDSDKVPAALLADWPKLPSDQRTDVVGMLCGRKTWAGVLLDALKKGTLTKQDISENDVRRILVLQDAELTKKVETLWGKLREQTPAKVEEQLAKLRRQLA